MRRHGVLKKFRMFVLRYDAVFRQGLYPVFQNPIPHLLCGFSGTALQAIFTAHAV
jgi:hypothetical protein